ncbi:hypothetical protein [Sediminicola luteus]|uniref:Curlin n=1 Tax=Sediminicola luteus TaxID=319238 RepID=A0ABV2TSB2_9FLAO
MGTKHLEKDAKLVTFKTIIIMKKVILCAAALMIGGFAFAQGTAPVAHQGGLPTTPSGTANDGMSIQNGNDHKVLVQQAGQKNTVFTDQDNQSTTIGANLAWIRQSGVNTTESGVANMADVLQDGDNNLSSTDQNGDMNNAVTNQGQTDDTSSGNDASIQQGVGWAEGNSAAIEQDGTDNIARTIQFHDNNVAWTDQDGTDNQADILQNAAPDKTDPGHMAYVKQLGGDNIAEIDQSGKFNRAFTNQGAGVAGGGDFDVDPTGIFTKLSDTDSGGTFDGESTFATAYQKQEGEDNDAYIEQFGAGTSSVDGNYAEQTQTAASKGSKAYITQNAYGVADGTGSKARQFQDGDTNEAGISQLGYDHKAQQLQSGADNAIYSSQRGTGNVLYSNQSEGGNYGLTEQRGDYNVAVLLQTGGQRYTISQGMDDWGTTGNQVVVEQLPADGVFMTDYSTIECGFTPLTPGTPASGLTLADVCADCIPNP